MNCISSKFKYHTTNYIISISIIKSHNNCEEYFIRIIRMMESDSESSEKPIDDQTVRNLAKGLLELYEPPLTTINTHLKELIERQETIHNMLVTERRRLEDLQNDATLDALLADIATNREKLTSLSTTMVSLHKKVQTLQIRAKNVEKVAKSRASTSHR